MFLLQAQRELSAGDLLQASEKGWGAVAHYVKAISHDLGWPHNAHHLVVKNAFDLGGGAPEFDRLFRAAKDLHTNFYEGMYNARTVRLGLEDAARLVEWLKQIDRESAYRFARAR